MHVGFAAGYLPLTERMRVREYLRLYGQLYGIADPNPLIEQGLERFRIGDLAAAMGTELSSGQRTLIGIVRATLHRPRLLVLDEPTASLDPDVAQRVRDGAARLCAPTAPRCLMTSHDMSDVERVCERVVFLSHGRIVADGTAGEGRGRRTATAISRACSSTLPRVTIRPVPSRATTRESRDCRDPIQADERRKVVAAYARRSSRRHAYVLVRSPHRLFDVSLWPLVDVLLFGSLAAFVGTSGHGARGEGVRLPARRHRALARDLPVADRDEHRAARGDLDPQPPEPDGHAAARGRVPRWAWRCSAWSSSSSASG